MKNTLLKVLALVLAVSTVISFAACGGKGENENVSETVQDITESAASADEAEAIPETTEAATEAETTEPETTVAETTEAPTEKETETETTEAAEKIPSTKAEIVKYYNEAINAVKPDSKQIVENYERVSQVSELELGKAASLAGMANKLISNNMGEVAASAGRVMSSREDKNRYFPVEKTDWSSKLTANDVKSATCTEENDVYTITIYTEDDAPSENTGMGIGHNGKAFSVVNTKAITDNAGPAKALIKNVKTGNSGCKAVIKVDKATGHVTHANFYMPWGLYLTALGVDISMVFATETDFDVKW
ncbi:MAG: hypothetical protein K6F09_02375 [Clostridiales bacterium]|nr:hypothetical protein [Clostridiales bacterium]